MKGYTVKNMIFFSKQPKLPACQISAFTDPSFMFFQKKTLKFDKIFSKFIFSKTFGSFAPFAKGMNIFQSQMSKKYFHCLVHNAMAQIAALNQMQIEWTAY